MGLTPVDEVEEDIENSRVPLYMKKSKVQHGIEFSMRETNLGIFNNMMLKKIGARLGDIDFNTTSDTQLKWNIQRITEDVINEFSTLKILASSTVIQQHIENLIQMIRNKKSPPVFTKLFSFKDLKKDDENVVDYKGLENILIKTYEENVKEINRLNNEINEVNKLIHSLKTEIASKHRQVKNETKIFR